MQERVIQMRGTVYDVPSEEVPADYWSYSKNVFFRDLSTQRVPGYESFYHVAGDHPIFAYPVQRISAALWLFVIQRGADVLVVRWDGTTATILHTYAATDGLTLNWQATDLNGVIILNNNKEAPRWWDEVGGTMEPLPGWPVNVVCRSIRSYKFHLLAMALTDTAVQNYYEYMWSDQAEPGGIPQSWTAAPETDAGNSQFPVQQGFIVDALPLRDSLAVYKDFSVGLVQYIGGIFVFQQRGLYISAGMINARCVAEVNGFHFVFTQDDIIKHDGNSMDSICTHEVRRYIFGNMNGEAIRYCQVVKRHITDELWWCYPTGNNPYCTEAAVYNTRTERWSFRPLPDLSCLSYGLIPDPGGKATWGSRDNSWREDPHRWDDKFYSNTADEIIYVQPYLANPETGPELNPDVGCDNPSRWIPFGANWKVQGGEIICLGLIADDGIYMSDITLVSGRTYEFSAQVVEVTTPGNIFFFAGTQTNTGASIDSAGMVKQTIVADGPNAGMANTDEIATCKVDTFSVREIKDSGSVFVTDRGFTEDGKEIEAEVKREGFQLDEDNFTNLKYINEIWPHVEGRKNDVLMVQVGGSMHHGGPVSWSPAKPYTLGNPSGKVDVHSVGRLTSFRFYSNGGAPWRLHEFKVRYKTKGRF